MAYVEGFVVPVKTARKDEYIAMSRAVSAIYLEHGATRCVETWGDDVPYGERTSFPRAVELAEDETAAFSWMEFPDRATRDRAHKAVFADPRMEPLMDLTLVSGPRMIVGGFDVILDAS